MPEKKGVEVKKYDRAMRSVKSRKTALKWYSPKRPPFLLAGFPWFKKDRIYRRMPLKPNYPLPKAVNSLANCTSGGQIKFRTNSPVLSIKIKLSGPANLVHMPATGQCGFDCYIGAPGRHIYRSTTLNWKKLISYKCELFNFKNSKMRNITLNFPLYQGVEKVSIGLSPKARLLPPVPFRINKPIVVYGTSMTQGGCASRPGMSYTNILSRYFNIEFVNLGFSGSGKGEPEVAKTIAEIKNPLCFVLDYEGNCPDIELFKKTFPEFIRILRKAHPDIPILAISLCKCVMDLYDKTFIRHKKIRKNFQKKITGDLKRKGDRLLFFQDGDTLLGNDFHECTVDGVHPTDLGFLRIARTLAPVFRKILLKIEQE